MRWFTRWLRAGRGLRISRMLLLRMLRLPGLLLGAATALMAVGCAQTPLSIDAAQLPRDHLFAPPPEAVAVETGQLFVMSEAMRLHAELALRQPGTWRDRRQALIDALYRKNALRLAYDAEITRTAAEAFEARAGNCLSLVLMTAAFARHLGVPVAFQQVLIDDEFSRAGDLFFVSGHVNILLGRPDAPLRGGDWWVVDFLPQVDLRGQRTVPLEENTLVAMFFNNRAAEALARGDSHVAYWLARTALERDPHFAATANTLAVVYQRSGHGEAAELALRYSIEREPRRASAWANLIRLLRDQGREAEAQAAAQRLAALEPHPPFHFFELGRTALQQGDAAQAREHFLRELRLQPQQHEVHFWLAQAYAMLGDAKAVARHLGLAAEYSPTRQTRAIYSAKLERLRATRQQ